MRVVALIPAHNEEAGIVRAVRSLQEQHRPPDQIIVVADNCTDATEALAAEAGADVWATVGNQHKKAGALNQVLDRLLPILAPEDVVFVQDADSFIDPEFLSRGLEAYVAGVGGVGGVFRGRIDAESRWGRLVQWFQANEYARYELDIRAQRGRVLVLTGTATLLRVSILREVVEARRSGRLPGPKRERETRMPRKMTAEEREVHFWSKFTETTSGCLLWTGRVNEDGYGTFDVPVRPGRNTSVLVHRQAWEYRFGCIPDGLHVLHRCDTPLCAAEDHLFLGTHADNMADMVTKGRKPSRHGERNGRAKLTRADVDEMRKAFTGKRGEKAAFARQYGLSPTTISAILSGRLWPEAGDESVESQVYDTRVLTED